MATTAVCMASMAIIAVSFTVLAIARPEIPNRCLDIVDKVVDSLFSKDVKKDSDMGHENKRGRVVNH